MFSHRVFDIRTFEISGFGTGYKNNIVAGADVLFQISKRRSDDAAAPVASDRFAYFFWGGYSDSKVMIIIFFDIRDQRGGDKRLAFSV